MTGNEYQNGQDNRFKKQPKNTTLGHNTAMKHCFEVPQMMTCGMLAKNHCLSMEKLHNNLRMTWGKQLVQWAPTPQQAHRWAIDLNHRYALDDGRDPSSYGGLLWCFGQFDRTLKATQAKFSEQSVSEQPNPPVEAYRSGQIH